MSQGHDRPARPPITPEVLTGITLAIDIAFQQKAGWPAVRVAKHWIGRMETWMVWAESHREFLLGEYVHHNQKDHGRSVVSPQSGRDGDTDCKVCAYLQNKLSGLGLEAL